MDSEESSAFLQEPTTNDPRAYSQEYIPQYPALFILGSIVIFQFTSRSNKPSFLFGPLPNF